MSANLTISAAWEVLDKGEPEEIAAFGQLEMTVHGVLLTEGQDVFVNRLRNGPFISNYHCAEWLAWNWWRLRWEPRSGARDWPFAHKMSSIGHGYVWPNITIHSDGERIVLTAKSSSKTPNSSFRYIKNWEAVVRAIDFEGAVDAYITQVLAQLTAETVLETDLHRIWAELQSERRDPALSVRRRFEALMGCEPGEANEHSLASLIKDTNELGEDTMGEIAAQSMMSRRVRTADHFRDIAKAVGFTARPSDAARLSPQTELPDIGHHPAWRRGAAAASALRRQAALGLEPISNRQLEQIAGVVDKAIESLDRHDADMAFALDGDAGAYAVFRSKWEVGRRFELARLIGDRVATRHAGNLRPATSADTYRQKVQRAFAAEFLCPFDALRELLQGDYSAEAIEDAAHDFSVSERTVRTMLVNHGHIDRDQIEGANEYEVAA